MARRHTIQCSWPNTHTLKRTAGCRHAGKEAGKERGRMEDGREGAMGGREEAMMRGKVGAGVEEGREGRVEEGNE